MMRPITQALSICLVLFGCHTASADEAQDFLKYFSWWQGEWEVKIKTGDDIETSSMTIEHHEPACHTVTGAGISLWGYDSQLRTWVGTGFMNDGSRFKDVISPLASDAIRPGVVDKSKRESWEADGTKVITESTWTYQDDDTAVIEQSRKTASGENLPTTVLTCKRIKGSQAAAQEWLKFFVGRWEVQEKWRTYPVDGDADETEWNAYQTVTDWKEVAEVAAITVVRNSPNASTSTLGWDPVKGALVQTGYLGNGTCFRVEFGKLEKIAMKGKVTISFASGETGEGTFTVTKEGDHEYKTEWQAVATDDMVLEGNATFKR